MDTWESNIFVHTRVGKKIVLGQTINKIQKFKRQEIFDGIDWAQRIPEQIFNTNNNQTSKKKASIHLTTKKLMAREWARAWGNTNAQNMDCLEREAAYLKRRMERKKIV